MKKIKSIVFNKKNSVIFVLILILVIVIIFKIFTRRVDEYVIEDHKLYQYLSGIKVEYEGKIKLNKTKNKITTINFKDIEINLDSNPIYYKNEKKVIFPENMSVIKAREGTQFRINYYSILYKDLDYCTVEDGNIKSKLYDTVLYDGKDLYFFTSNVTVSYKDEDYELEPLSYIIVDTFNHTVEIYNSKADDYKTFENAEEEVIIKGNNYKLNATYDILYYYDNSIILVKDIAKLKHLSQ